MTTKVEKSVLVNVPVSVAYNQWTQFEDFPQFMGGVTKVTQLSDDRLEWVAEIAGVRRQWEARILEQVPDRKVAWAATEGATNAGAVTFEDVGGGQTSIHLSLEYEPEGLVEKVGDKLNVVEKQAEGDLERFKAFIESEGYASGAWRGSVASTGTAGTPGVEDAAASRGDSGKAGVSPAAVAAGVGAAAVAAAAVAANRKSDDTAEETVATTDYVEPVVPAGTTSGTYTDTTYADTTTAGATYADTMSDTAPNDAVTGATGYDGPEPVSTDDPFVGNTRADSDRVTDPLADPLEDDDRRGV